MGEPIWGKWANNYDVPQLQVLTSPWKWGKSIQRFQRYTIRKVWTQFVAKLTSFGPWASPYGANGQMTMTAHNYRPRQFHRTSNLTSVKRLQRYGFRKSGSRPPGPWRQYPSSPEGWGVKSQWSVLLAFSVGNPLVTGEFFSQWTINKDIRTKSWWLSSQCVIIHKSSKRCTNIYCVIEIAINEGIRKIHISVSWKTSTRIITLYLNL